MARRVFFSFHYSRDAWRASQVRNSWIGKPNRESAGYLDAVQWENLKKKGDEAIKRWINEQFKRTSVTVVLIGAETSKRPWVKYEIKRSFARGNGLLGIYIHRLKNEEKQTDTKGEATFGSIGKDANGDDVYFFQVANTYDWVTDDGRNNLGKWVEEAARKAGK